MTPTVSEPRRYPGQPVSWGTAAGRLFQADVTAHAGAAHQATPAQVRAAFAAVAAERSALAERLRAAGRADEADIVAVAALMAADPVLADSAVAAMHGGADAPAAIRLSAEAQAMAIAAIPNPELAERAADVRQVATAVVEHLAGQASARPAGDVILVRRDVAAADLIELAEHGLAGAASVAGSASSHAAIVARGLGIPMITGVDASILREQPGLAAILSADGGALTVEPRPAEFDRLAGKCLPVRDAARGAVRAAQARARTADGAEIALLCNVASLTETRRGLAAGAEGVGLLRTEIPFTAREDWPSRADHLAQLTPILAELAGRPATVRLLDFSGDKVPPFLRVPGRAAAAVRAPALRQAAPHGPDSAGAPQAAGEPGLAALLAHPDALRDQLGAALAAGRAASLAILVPMVSTLAEVARVRGEMATAAAEAGAAPPRLGIMVELAATAASAQAFGGAVDFFSIGTNDLTSQVLGLHRHDAASGPGLAADPRVLAVIGRVVEAAAAAGIDVSVCGDAAADPVVLPLLVGLGVRALSVPAATVRRVREDVARLDSGACAALAARSLRASGIGEVREMVRHAQVS